MSNETKTPLTDAVFDKGTDAYGQLTPSGVAKLLDLAESLERQLADSVSKRDVARAVWIEWGGKMIPNGREAILALMFQVGITPDMAKEDER